MEGVVVEVRARAPCKHLAIKDNRICDRSARGFDGQKANVHSFFSPENNTGGDKRKRELKENSFWIPTTHAEGNTDRATVRPRWYSEIAGSCGLPKCIGCIGH